MRWRKLHNYFDFIVSSSNSNSWICSSYEVTNEAALLPFLLLSYRSDLCYSVWNVIGIHLGLKRQKIWCLGPVEAFPWQMCPMSKEQGFRVCILYRFPRITGSENKSREIKMPAQNWSGQWQIWNQNLLPDVSVGAFYITHIAIQFMRIIVCFGNHYDRAKTNKQTNKQQNKL